MLTPSELVMLINYSNQPKYYNSIGSVDIANDWANKLHTHGLIDKPPIIVCYDYRQR